MRTKAFGFIHKFKDVVETLVSPVINFVSDSIYPRNCFSCGKSGVYLCPDCLDKCEIPPRFFIPHLDNLIIGGSYDEPALRKAVLLLKYRGIREIAQDLGCLLKKRLEENFLRGDFPNTFIAPIPVSKNRERERGFNQALLLGEAVSNLSGFKTLNGLLEKITDTPPQVKIRDKKERRQNVKNSFAVNREVLLSFGEKRNLRIILVDDVITTGATIAEAARVLKKAGVKSVVGLAVAKG